MSNNIIEALAYKLFSFSERCRTMWQVISWNRVVSIHIHSIFLILMTFGDLMTNQSSRDAVSVPKTTTLNSRYGHI